ncbi:MAG: hypothetical protein K6E20_00140 [Acholeplasmatales bacterium]|nr:hypothetical protein [Acholeplasmatales bacterium]
MKLYIYKENDQIVTKIIDDKGNKEEFSNLKMIDYLYNNKGKKVDFDFDETISDDEKSKINEVFKEIYDVINPKKEVIKDLVK